MRVNITAIVMAAGLCAVVAAVVLADGTVEERQEAVKLYRGTSIIAASDPKSSVYVANFTPAACELRREAQWKKDGLTRTAGEATYKCQVETRVIVSFHPAAPTCPSKPADEQRQQTCPAGTVGTWIQDRTWTLDQYPTCWVQGDWTPSAPPAGMCAPVTTGTATLSWTPPTLNTGGSTLTNLAGFRIHYGTSPAALTQTVQVANPAVVRYAIEDLAPGTYYFAVRAYTSGGTESALSNIASKVIL